MPSATQRCSQCVYGPLVSFEGTPEEEQLRQQAHQLLHVDWPVFLDYVLALEAAPSTMSLMDAMPVFVLDFNVKRWRGPDPVTEADRPRLLEAFGRLVQFSTKLNASPRLKTTFWLAMATKIRATHVHTQLFERPEFPQFMIDCGYGFDPWSNMNQSLCDALCDFMTTAVDDSASTIQLPIGFSFAVKSFPGQRWRSREDLALIERMLDRISPSSTHPYKIAMLDFNGTTMEASTLDVVARIAAKSKSGFYQIQHIKLNAVTPSVWEVGLDTARSRQIRDIASAAFSPVGLPPFWSFLPQSTW